MQISRHWRMNAQRYRLEGTRTSNGEVRFQHRLNAVNAPAETQEVRQSLTQTVATRAVAAAR